MGLFFTPFPSQPRRLQERFKGPLLQLTPPVAVIYKAATLLLHTGRIQVQAPSPSLAPTGMFLTPHPPGMASFFTGSTVSYQMTLVEFCSLYCNMAFLQLEEANTTPSRRGGSSAIMYTIQVLPGCPQVHFCKAK